MPLYDWLCEDCGKLWEECFSLIDLPDTIPCTCGGKSHRTFTKAPTLTGELGNYARRKFPYYDECLDQTFNTLREKNTYLKENKIRVKERGERVAPKKKKAKKGGPTAHLIKANTKAEFDRKYDQLIRDTKEKVDANKTRQGT